MISVISSYTRQEAHVSWGTHISGYSRLVYCVKQGGIILAQLFTLYIDKLLLELKQSGYGYHVGDNNNNLYSLHKNMYIKHINI